MAGSPRILLSRVTATNVASPAAETAIITTPVTFGGSPQVGQAAPNPVTVRVTANVTEGTTGTAFIVRVRQGNGLSGAMIDVSLTQTNPAAATEQVVYEFDDASGWIQQQGGAQYTVSVAQTGATAAGTVNSIKVEVLQ